MILLLFHNNIIKKLKIKHYSYYVHISYNKMAASNDIELKYKLENTLKKSIDNNDLPKAMLLIDLGIKTTYDDINHLLKYPTMVKLLMTHNMMTDAAYGYVIGYYPGKGCLKLTKMVTEIIASDKEKTRFKSDKDVFELALLSAVGHGQMDVVKYLLDTYTIDMSRAFVNSTLNNNVELVQLFIDKGVDVNVNNSQALINSAIYGHMEVTKLLIDKGANINAQNGIVLNYSVVNDRINIVKLLLDNGADIHANDNKAINSCIVHNRVNIARLLLSKGAKPTLGMSSMHSTEMIALLNEYNMIKLSNSIDQLQEENNTLKQKLESYERDMQKLQNTNNVLNKKLFKKKPNQKYRYNQRILKI